MRNRASEQAIENAIQGYIAGESVKVLAARYHISNKKLSDTLKERGLFRDQDTRIALAKGKWGAAKRARTNLPEEEICQRYLQGESELSLAHAFNVDRGTIHLRLKAASIPLRTTAEINTAHMASRTAEERQANSKAAHDAVRGTTKSFEEKCKVAQTRQERQLGVSSNEQLLQIWLGERGIEAIPQKAIGPYNADLAFDTVIVEINGGSWHISGQHAARAAKRYKYLMNEGYSIIIIWVDRRRWPLTLEAVDYVIACCEQERPNPIVRVINGRGKEFHEGNAYYKKALGL